MFEINNKYLKKKLYNKIFLKLFNISVFKNISIFINFLSLFDIFLLNKRYKFKNKITDSLTFNYFKKSYIFLCYSLIHKNSKMNKLKILFLVFYNILHCFLHSQNFKDEKNKNNKKIIFIQKKVLIKYGFFLKKYRL